MKTFGFILLLFFFFLYVQSQNNLIVFSEGLNKFQIEYHGKLYYSIPQTDVKITQIPDHLIKVKIIFEDKNISPIDTSISLYHPSKPIQNQDIIYYIPKNKHLLKYLATLPSSDLKPVIPEIDTSIQVKTKEEKNIQKIIFLNDTNNTCLQAIDSTDFNKAIQHIQKIPNQDRKIVLIEQFIKHNCFTQTQGQDIINQVPFEVEKLKIMKLILPKLTNVFDLWFWKDNLKYPIAQQAYTEFYAQYLQQIKNFPTLPDSLYKTYSNTLSKLDNDQSKSYLLKILFSHFSLEFYQLETFIKLIQHDQNKEELLKYAYFSIKNKSDFEKAIDFVHFKETKERLKIFYDKQK